MLGLALKGVQICLLIGALVLVWMAVSPLALSQSPSVTLPPALAAAGSTRGAFSDYKLIGERNLFAVARPVEAPEAPVEEEIVETKLNALLLGTVVIGKERAGQLESSALVRDTTGEVLALGIKDTLADGKAVVVGIEQRRIVIEHQGRREALLLDEEATSSSPDSDIPDPRRARNGGTGPTLDSLRNARINSGAEMLGVMRSMSSLGRFAADRDDEGRLNGIRVTRINDGSPLGDLGVQVGDRVAAINGIPLGGDTPGLGAIATLADGSDPVLTIEDASGRQREIVLPRSVLDAGFGPN